MCWRYEIYQLGDKFRIRAELCNHMKSLIMSCIMSGFSEAVRKKSIMRVKDITMENFPRKHREGLELGRVGGIGQSR
jgi:hypothetical protein